MAACKEAPSFTESMIARHNICVALLGIDPWKEEAPNLRPFNYGMYRIAAALRADGRVDDLHIVEGRHGEVEEIIERVEVVDPDIIGVSAYLWSLPTLFAAAERLKRSRPDRMIVIGGPSARAEMMQQSPFAGAPQWVDALVVTEAEQAMCGIVASAMNGTDLGSVGGLLLPDGNAWRSTARPAECNLNHLASPFQNGMAPRDVTGHLERFKGCQLNCTFCQWGEPSEARWVLSREFLIEELRAYRESQARGALIVDAGLNMGTEAFANLVAAEREVGFLRDTSLHCELYPRTLGDEHLDFLAGLDAHVGVGLQSFNPEALETVERPATVGNFEHIVGRITEVAEASVEIILGLPGDTPQSFRTSFERARRLPCSTRVYQCLVLPDALMRRGGAALQMVYDPITLEMRSCLGWSAEDLRREQDRLSELLAAEGGGLHGHGWWHFEAPKGSRQSASARTASLPDGWCAEVAALVRRVTRCDWELRTATLEQGGLRLRCETTHGELTVDAWSAGTARPAYRVVGDVAIGYSMSTDRPIAAQELRHFEALIPSVAQMAREELARAQRVSSEEDR